MTTNITRFIDVYKIVDKNKVEAFLKSLKKNLQIEDFPEENRLKIIDSSYDSSVNLRWNQFLDGVHLTFEVTPWYWKTAPKKYRNILKTLISLDVDIITSYSEKYVLGPDISYGLEGSDIKEITFNKEKLIMPLKEWRWDLCYIKQGVFTEEQIAEIPKERMVKIRNGNLIISEIFKSEANKLYQEIWPLIKPKIIRGGLTIATINCKKCGKQDIEINSNWIIKGAKCPKCNEGPVKFKIKEEWWY